MPDESITMYDEQGQPVKVSREEWLTEVVPDALQQAWDNAEMLYGVLYTALNQNAGLAIIDGIRRLAELEPAGPRSRILEGTALMQAGRPTEGETIFREYMEQHGPDASMLTNMARIQFDRGERAQAEATLRKALAHDANLEAALVWYLTIQKQRGGDAAAEAALQQFAADEKNWRARMWIAGAYVRKGLKPEAVGLYKKILAGHSPPPDAMVQLTGELGRAGMTREMVDLILPVYELNVHGPLAGLNLMHAMISCGLSTEAGALLDALQALNLPMLGDVLKRSGALLAGATAARKNAGAAGAIEAAAAQGAAQPAAAGPMEVVGVPLIYPVWAAMLGNPDWLLPPLKPDAIKVAVFSLADLIRPATDKDAKPAAEGSKSSGGSTLARSLPLYLAEAVRLRTDAAAMCVVPWVPKIGPATINAPWPLPQMLTACPKEFTPDYVVCGALTRGSRGTKVELYVVRVRDKEPLRTLRVPVADDFAGAAAACEQALLAALAGEGVKSIPDEKLPPVQSADQYMTCLGHLLAQTMAANQLIEPRRLPDAALMLEGFFTLAEAEERSPLPMISLLAGMKAIARYAPDTAEKLQPRMAALLSGKWAGNEIVRRLKTEV